MSAALSAESRDKIHVFATMLSKVASKSAESGYNIYIDDRRIEDDGPGTHVTWVGQVWPIRKLKIWCEGCDRWARFNVMLSGNPSHEVTYLPSLCQVCRPPQPRKTWDEISKDAGFLTRCKNLGITPEEALDRRLKALGLDGMV